MYIVSNDEGYIYTIDLERISDKIKLLRQKRYCDKILND